MKYFATKISDNLHKTPEGYLLALNVPIGRVGVMEYARGETPLEVGSDGIVRISRSAEELFRKETIASFEGKPLTIKHPDDFVSSQNWKDLAKGIMQNVRQDSDDLVCDLLIMDADTISLVEDGLRQLSCGYEAEYEQTGDGEGIQKGIVGNHVALVEEGRAGDAYQIKDEKGVTTMNVKLNKALKRLLGKTADQVVKDEEMKEKKEKESKDSSAYDELVTMFKDLGEKIEKFGQPQGDEESKEDKNKKPEEKKDDAKDEEDVPASLEDRLKAVEAALAKLLEGESEEESEESFEDESEEEEVVIDEEEVADEEGDFKLTGDEKSRVEILSPGMSPQKDFKVSALKSAYKTADGKAAIEALTNGKPNFANAGQVDMLFVAASELMKAKRGVEFAKTKRTTDFSSAIFQDESAMTAEKMNDLNNKHYNKK